MQAQLPTHLPRPPTHCPPRRFFGPMMGCRPRGSHWCNEPVKARIRFAGSPMDSCPQTTRSEGEPRAHIPDTFGSRGSYERRRQGVHCSSHPLEIVGPLAARPRHQGSALVTLNEQRVHDVYRWRGISGYQSRVATKLVFPSTWPLVANSISPSALVAETKLPLMANSSGK